MPAFPLLMLLVFALTLFTSATLLFTVEPMIGKMILPLLGGTPAVWNTCMVFFQAVLLAGYAYAHASTARLRPRAQVILHLGVLLVPFVFFPLAVNKSLIAGHVDNPIPALLVLLLVSVGLPMFAVCTSAPLLQRWFSSTRHPSAGDPYFLYGASNLGSMLALLAYPVLIEPHLAVRNQSWAWAVGYGVLVALTAVCGAFLWKADSVKEAPADPVQKERSAKEFIQQYVSPRERVRRGIGPSGSGGAGLVDQVAGGEVTWSRRLRWVLLALVPSSLMLGATTYITTDIASIPLLWVLPLALYLLTFIIVFAKIPVWVQQAVVWLGLTVVVLVAGVWFVPTLTENATLRFAVAALAVLASLAGLALFRTQEPRLLHKAMVLLLPLIVLLMLFIMLSEFKLDKGSTIGLHLALHLATLFVAAMVCHGELALDRPAPQHLTEYFLWMSVGGVLGGLFNSLVAPLAFNAIVEYHLALVVACLLLPRLGRDGAEGGETSSRWALIADVSLAVLFFAMGGLLLGLRYVDHDLNYDALKLGPWKWDLVALLAGIGVGVFFALRARAKRADGWLDLALPLGLLVLVAGLTWGLPADLVAPRLKGFAEQVHVEVAQLRLILAFGLPAVLCYTFVERPLRFGLGVGAFLLATGFCGLVKESTVFQTRSFFGVLKVEETSDNFGERKVISRRLIHGTTMHGQQFSDPTEENDLDLRRIPLTYYHRTGPIGQVVGAYNDTRPNIAVIGLGTGTMSAYAEKGQHVTFYDIDAAVRDISFSTDRYFTYVSDAKERGARIDLVLGDARLTMEQQKLADTDKYGLIVVDAFSSDAIPIHLITLEALRDVYLKKLREDGLLAFHISNRYLDLQPVLGNLAGEVGLVGLFQSDNDESYAGKSASSWVVLARKPEYLARLPHSGDWSTRQSELQNSLVALVALPDATGGLCTQGLLLHAAVARVRARWQPLEARPAVGVWTDDYAPLFRVFSWGTGDGE